MENKNTMIALHERIAGLFEELRDALDSVIESARSNGDIQFREFRAKAILILGNMDELLKFEMAGDLGQTLRLMYAEATKRIRMERRESRVQRIESAREMICEVEKAWIACSTLK